MTAWEWVLVGLGVFCACWAAVEIVLWRRQRRRAQEPPLPPAPDIPSFIVRFPGDQPYDQDVAS